MTISAKVIAHSRTQGAPDLITLQLRYPRFIHAEFMTHRVFSRNASSSRAIPVERMIQDVIDDPAMPVAWGSNKPGMQAGVDISTAVDFSTHSAIESAYGINRTSPTEAWLIARDLAVEVARGFAAAGYHKQVVNRLLEPFGHISVVVTATEWDNFFALRCHPDADPTMRALAEAMRDAIQASEPREVKWHLPYIADWELGNICPDAFHTGWEDEDYHRVAMISAARCARVSYLNHDGSDPDIEKDLMLAERLLHSRHMSPFEHQARAGNPLHGLNFELWGNFNNWEQFRKQKELLAN